MDRIEQEVDTGEFINVEVAGERKVIYVKGLLRRVEYLQGQIIDMAKRAHQQYHIPRGYSEKWQDCTLMICLDAQDTLRNSVTEFM